MGLVVVAHGNAGSATKFQTARKINGTNFDGSGDIITSKWGTARTIGVSGAISGNASVDGSGNVIINTTQNNIAVLNGNLTGSDSPTLTGTLAYPEGYNQNNCVVISYAIKHKNKDFWHTGSVFNSVNIFGAFPLDIKLDSDNISIETRDIRMLNDTNPTIPNITGTYNIKIVLMKIY